MAYPLEFAPCPPSSERLTLERRQQVLESPFNYKRQTIHGASRWILDFTFPRMTVARAEAVAAWGLSMNGTEGTFKYYPTRTIVSTLTGRTLALPGYATNHDLRLGGWSAGSLSTLRVGQWFTIGKQLLRIVNAGAVADANGQVTVTFHPELRVNLAAGTAVEFVKPYGLFSFATSSGIAYTLDPDRLPEFGTINAIEAVA